MRSNIFAAFSMLLLLVTASSCIIIQPAPPVTTSDNVSTPAVQVTGWPRIISFSADAENITPGENVTLSWQVADAVAAGIDPVVGNVPISGNAVVSPQSTTKYTLTAAGESGTATAWVVVNVADLRSLMPDLVITGVSYNSGFLYYTIKNIGSIDARPTSTFLFDSSGVQKDQSWVGVLKAGESKTLPFTNYDYDGSKVTICADGGNETKEASRDNNCYVPAFGIKFSYDFQQYASRAIWRGSAGRLSFGPTGDTAAGLADRLGQTPAADGKTYPNVIVMAPPDGSYQWIEGYFGDWQGGWQAPGFMAPLEMPAQARFTASVALPQDAASGSSLNFLFGLQDENGNINWWPGVKVSASDARLFPMDIDLSSYIGKKVMAVLRIESGIGAVKARGLWITARISQ